MGKFFADNYVLVSLTVKESGAKQALENPGGNKYLEQMGGAQSGLPFYVFLDRNGKKIADSNAMPGGQNIGYPLTPPEIKAFEKLIEKTAPRLTAAQRSRIIAYFTKPAPR